jgi:hypothetical protein
MDEWLRRKEADMAAKELRTEDDEEDPAIVNLRKFSKAMQDSSIKLADALTVMRSFRT